MLSLEGRVIQFSQQALHPHDISDSAELQMPGLEGRAFRLAQQTLNPHGISDSAGVQAQVCRHLPKGREPKGRTRLRGGE